MAQDPAGPIVDRVARGRMGRPAGRGRGAEVRAVRVHPARGPRDPDRPTRGRPGARPTGPSPTGPVADRRGTGQRLNAARGDRPDRDPPGRAAVQGAVSPVDPGDRRPRAGHPTDGSPSDPTAGHLRTRPVRRPAIDGRRDDDPGAQRPYPPRDRRGPPAPCDRPAAGPARAVPTDRPAALPRRAARTAALGPPADRRRVVAASAGRRCRRPTCSARTRSSWPVGARSRRSSPRAGPRIACSSSRSAGTRSSSSSSMPPACASRSSRSRAAR